MKIRPDTSNLATTAEQAAADIRGATERVSEAADAAGGLMVALTIGVVVALALATFALVSARGAE
jgi:hypothetical protein